MNCNIGVDLNVTQMLFNLKERFNFCLAISQREPESASVFESQAAERPTLPATLSSN